MMNIFEAINNNDIEKVKELLNSGVDVNLRDINKQTPLHTSCSNNRIKIAKLLLAHPNIDVNIKREGGWSPLYWACISDQIKIVKLLLAHPDIDVNNKDNYGRTPLHYVSHNRRKKIIKLLLQHPDINLSSKNKNGETPFDLVVNNSVNEEIVKLFLDLSRNKIKIRINFQLLIKCPELYIKIKNTKIENLNKILDSIEE